MPPQKRSKKQSKIPPQKPIKKRPPFLTTFWTPFRPQNRILYFLQKIDVYSKTRSKMDQKKQLIFDQKKGSKNRRFLGSKKCSKKKKKKQQKENGKTEKFCQLGENYFSFLLTKNKKVSKKEKNLIFICIFRLSYYFIIFLLFYLFLSFLSLFLFYY